MYTAAKLLTDVPKLAGLVLPVRGELESAANRTEGGRAGRLGNSGADARWAKIVAEEAALFRGADRSKVLLAQVAHIEDFPTWLDANAAKVGPIHGILEIAGDSGFGGTELEKRRSNCDAPFVLYQLCRRAPEGHPLSTVQGFVQCTIAGLPGPEPKNLTRERPWPIVEKMDGTGRGGTAAYQKGKKRVEALLNEEYYPLFGAPPVGRPVPVAVIRPPLILGCSNLLGCVGPVGWSNQNNMNLPMPLYYFSGKPSPEDSPKVGFLPPKPFLEASCWPSVPVDVEANHHVAVLARMMSDPVGFMKVDGRYSGTIPAFNSSNELDKLRLSQWTMLNYYPHFDEKDFDFPNKRSMKLLEQAAAKIGGEEGKKLEREIRNFKNTYGSMLFLAPDRRQHPFQGIEIEVGRIRWLEKEMHPSDREKWPVVFTERLDWAGTIRAGHDYLFRHIVKGPPPTSALAKL